MEFYKKNPKIEGNITIQGRLLTDDTVVCGDEFKPFADPKTFPGIPPRLIGVDFKSLTKDQQAQVQDFIADKKDLPPRHLGVIKSDQFTSIDGGSVKVIEIVKPVKAEPKKQEPKVMNAPKLKIVAEMFTYTSFAETFPGVTERNAKKALNSTTTLEALANASNSELRKMGISPSFYGRLRDKAAELLEQEE